MILPLRDENPLIIIPFQLVTVLLIIANTSVFMVEVFVPDGVSLVVAQLGAVPSGIIAAGMALVSLFKDKDFPLLDRGTLH